MMQFHFWVSGFSLTLACPDLKVCSVAYLLFFFSSPTPSSVENLLNEFGEPALKI